MKEANDATKEHLEDEIDGLKEEIKQYGVEIADKVERKELLPIKAQFSRFAEYKDLKHLHAMVIPEIAKFEQKVLNCNENIARYEEIIRGFDEVIQTKSSKISYDTLNKVVREDCTKKEDL